MIMEEVFDVATPRQIAALEEEFHLQLPQSYREFLLKVGGGVTDNDDKSSWHYVDEVKDELDIAIVFGTNSEEESCNIAYWMRKCGDEIWENSVLIAESVYSGFFVLVCGGENTGVWFWDDCMELPISTEENNVYFVADSFEDFLCQFGGKVTLPDGRVWKPTEGVSV